MKPPLGGFALHYITYLFQQKSKGGIGMASSFWQGFRAEWRVLTNLITLTRLIFCWVPIYLLFNQEYLYAMIGFALIAATDSVDGWVARKWNMVTKTGIILDPTVDKIIVISNLVALSLVDHRLLLPTAIIIIRELYVALILARARKQKKVVATIYSGKVKMWAQCIAMCLQYLALMGLCQALARDVLWLAVGLTISSGVEYFYQYRLKE